MYLYTGRDGWNIKVSYVELVGILWEDFPCTHLGMNILDYDLLRDMWRLFRTFRDMDPRIFDWYTIYQMGIRCLLHIRVCNLEGNRDIRVNMSKPLDHLSLGIDCWDRMEMENKDLRMQALQLWGV